MSESNDYMEQVMANQQKLAVDLRAKRQIAQGARHAQAIPEPPQAADDTGRFQMAQRARLAAPGPAEPVPAASVDVRVTGWWRWKTVIVPPNAHVVHTRRGHERPLHI